MRKIADMHNRLIAAFGALAPAEEARPQDGALPPIAFPRPVSANPSPSPAWLSLFSRLGQHRDGEAERVLAERHQVDAADTASLCDALGEIAVTRNAEGRILTANRTFRAIIGCAAPEGRSLHELGFQLRAQSSYPVDQVLPNAAGRDMEITGPAGPRVFLWRDVSVAVADGSVVLHGFARDVTAERLSRDEQEAARLKAEAHSVTKSRQLATVVHEIRTPLNGILGMGQLLGHTALTPEQQNYIGGIRQAGLALAQLVDDLLDYSTMEAGRFKLNTRAENLRQLIESVVEMLAPRAHAKQMEIGAIVTSDLPDLFDFDPARLRQVLFNVIGNAVKFTSEGGVLIRAFPDAGDVVITVADTGPGMTAEEQARIFAEFEQAGTTEARSGGTGLGMAISRRIVEEFGGTLSVESEKGRGATFAIRLPLRPAETGLALSGNDRALQDRDRATALACSRVLLLAPKGPSAAAILAMIETLGGTCMRVDTNGEAERLIAVAENAGAVFTDVIVDHRLAGGAFDGVRRCGLRRILLVNPEERSAQPQELYDAWLIRPLRERTLIDVLRGRLGGGETAAAKPAALPLPQASVSSPAGLSIILAEDDAVSAMLYSTILQRSGHHVTRVADFPSLLTAACGGTAADLVISDMHMPGGDIMEALVAITASAGRNGKPMPVIVLTGEGRENLHAQALSQGAAHVVEKPVPPEVLIDLVRQLETAAMRQAS